MVSPAVQLPSPAHIETGSQVQEALQLRDWEPHIPQGVLSTSPAMQTFSPPHPDHAPNAQVA